MRKAAFFILVSAVLSSAAAPAQHKDLALGSRVIGHFESKGEPAIQAALRFGMENKIPLGLVLASSSLCETMTDFQSDNATVLDTLEGLASRMPQYAWSIEDGTAVLKPRVAPQSASTLLDMVIPHFAAPLGPLKEQRLYLWMDVRAILRPNEGTLLNFLTSEAEPKFPPLQLTNVSVEQILNRLVSRQPYAAWILQPVSSDLREAVAQVEFVTLLPYPNGVTALRNVSCAASSSTSH